MKKSKKIWMIVAACCILVGGVMMVASAAAVGFDFSKFNTRFIYQKTYSVEVSYEEKTHTAENTFTQIEISTEWENVRFVLSEDDTCKVVCPVQEETDFTVEVENNTLRIIKNEDEWQKNVIGFQFSAPEDVTVYLPEKIYQALSVTTGSGNVFLPSDFTFADVNLLSGSGNLEIRAPIGHTVHAESASGKISVQAFNGETLELKTASGEIDVQDSTVKAIRVSSVSGNLEIKQTVASEEALLQSTSGDVNFERFDAPRMEVTTVSGNVSGSLQSGKQFSVNSLTGNVQVPPNTSQSQVCTVSSTSGDVELTVDAN